MPSLCFDLQRYAVHDGPGIRTLFFFKGCPLRCAWCANPESQHPGVELRQRAVRCVGCLACVSACTRGAIQPVKGQKVPHIQRDLCADCQTMDCVEECPEGALQSVGEAIDVDAVMKRLLADADFYRSSGGGVTFSGGEPLASADTLELLLRRCREAGVHTAVETSGHVKPARFRALAPLVDLFLFDVKLVDPVSHRRWCGADNRLILENLRYLARERPEHLVVRTPLVPGATDTDENIDAIADLLTELGVSRLELEPYHAYGIFKYGELGRDQTFDPGAPSPARIAEVVARFAARDITAAV